LLINEGAELRTLDPQAAALVPLSIMIIIMRFIESDIDRLRSRLRSLAREPLWLEAAPKLNQIDTKHAEEIFVTHGWLLGPVPKLKPTYAAMTQKYIAKEKRIGNPTRLIWWMKPIVLKSSALSRYG
jgi:hypothetical protein